MNENVMSCCHTIVPICMGESKNAKPKQTVLMLHHKRKNFYHNINNRHELPTKAELQQVGIFFSHSISILIERSEKITIFI